MRMIGQVPAEADARRFVDYLLTRSVAARAEEGQSGAWQIWVEHDDHLDAGLAELQRFQANPADARFDSAADAASIRKQQDKAADKRRQNFHDVRTTTFAPIGNAVPVTFVLIGVSVAVFVFGYFGSEKTADALGQLLFADPKTSFPEWIPDRLAMFKD
ncbi:MAG: glpG, partial [Phycisphaerales bacterium]|nr:glpG [Phycisphaerales bacterium]